MEPEPSDANTDETFDEEMMQLYFSMGDKPEDLLPGRDRELYAAWLKKHTHGPEND